MVSRARNGTLGSEVTSPPISDPVAGGATNPIGLAAALSWEVRPLLGRRRGVRKDGRIFSFLAGETPVHLVVAGVGAENAYQGARELLDRFPLRGLVAIGFAGALADSLVPGDLVLADHVFDQRTGERFACSEIWPVAKALRGGLLGATEFVASAVEKRSLAAEWGTVAVDMESAGVARAAAERQVRFSAIKAITDSSMQSISFDFARCQSEHKELSYWKIIREGMRTSQTIRDVWMLARGALAASRALAAALGSAELRGTR